MKLFTLALAGAALALSASSALAASKPAGQVESVSVVPASASHGAAVQASVKVTNPGDKRSKRLNLLLKLRAPDGESGLVLTSRRVGKLKPGQSRTVELAAFIPDRAPAGDSTLIACRAKKDHPDACGISRQQTPLRVLTPAKLSISPDSHAFGTRATGTTSPTRTFTVTNVGETSSTPIATSLIGADPNQFTKSADGCDGSALAAGDSCTVDVAFAPTSAGGKSAGIETSAAGTSATAALNGTGANPANLTIDPGSHLFGVQLINTTSGSQVFTLTNTGGVPSGTITTALGGANSGQFTKSNDGCDGQTLGAGAACTFEVAFAPTSSGAKLATASASAIPGGTASANLSGTGQTPANLEITPSSHDFGNVIQGTSSETHQFTITNTGEQTSGFPTITTTAGSPFPHTHNCIAPLAGGASCTVNVDFTPGPSDTGTFTAPLNVSASPGGSDSATQSGTAVSP